MQGPPPSTLLILELSLPSLDKKNWPRRGGYPCSSPRTLLIRLDSQMKRPSLFTVSRFPGNIDRAYILSCTPCITCTQGSFSPFSRPFLPFSSRSLLQTEFLPLILKIHPSRCGGTPPHKHHKVPSTRLALPTSVFAWKPALSK